MRSNLPRYFGSMMITLEVQSTKQSGWSLDDPWSKDSRSYQWAKFGLWTSWEPIKISLSGS